MSYIIQYDSQCIFFVVIFYNLWQNYYKWIELKCVRRFENIRLKHCVDAFFLLTIC
jgi:hypothetical protein